MSTLTAVRLVAGRELREAFRRKAIWIAAGLLLVGSSAAMIVPELVGDDGPTTYDVVVIGDDPGLVTALGSLEEPLDARLDITEADDVAEARRLVEDDEVDVGVVGGDAPSIIVQAGEHDRLVGAVRQALASDALAARLEAAGLSDAELEELFTAPAPRLDELDEESAERRGAAFGVSLVLYMLLLTLMIQVTNGTAMEKANRISEVLLPIVRPGALLFGKVLGIGVTGVVTLAAGIAPVVVRMVAGGDLPEGIGGALAGGAAWFVLGLMLYLTLAGSLGALVERQEDAGSVITPITGLMVGTFLVAQSAPDSPLGAVMAYIPLTSPLLVPTRLAVGASSPVELVASLVLLVMAIVVAGKVGSTIYGRAIVRTGRRLKLKEVLR